MSTRLGFEDLKKNVVEKGICAGCSTCVVVCPYKGVLEYVEGQPKVVGDCKVCGICSRVCPRADVQISEMEKFVFGQTRKPEEAFGIYRALHVVKSSMSDVLSHCQDGGAVTAILNSAFDSGIIDGAVLSGLDSSMPWRPQPFVATTKQDVIHCSGTRYTYSANLLALGKCITDGVLKKVAFVGTPCQILAFRQIQKIPLRKFSDRVVVTIGLFCSESFTYSGLMQHKINYEMKIDLQDIEKINIKGKMLLTLKNGKTAEISLKEARNYAEKKCRYCSDFSSELADIAVGGVGLDGRTLTIIRTEQGEKFLDNALEKRALEMKPVVDFPRAHNLLVQLSKLKRQNTQNIVK
ncbi:MAG: Coenzyme F420 hydrogenase/dehydrogenase, beta subunit C-terminal domain [Candidatus Bathyarchaeota archaeon]